MFELFCISVFVLQCLVRESDGALHPSPTDFAQRLQKLSVDGLGTEDMQLHFDSLAYNSITLGGNQILADLSTKMANKFKEKVNVAKKLKDAVEASYAGDNAFFTRTACCNADDSSLKFDSRFGTKVDLDNICVRISGAATSSPRHLQNNVLQAMKDNMEQYPTIKWQFFGSEEGMYTNYPLLKTSGSCTHFDPRYRPWYVEAASPKPKDVVLVIDVSGSMGTTLLSIAKEASKTVLDTLNPRDRVAVIAFSSGVQKPSGCFATQLATASPVNTKILKKFVDSRYAGGGTFYVKAFNGAFDILDVYHKHKSTNRQPVILFLTDGAPSEAEAVILQTVKYRNGLLATKAAILTFGVGTNVGKRASILSKLATQSEDDGGVGKYTNVPDTRNLRNKLATYYESFSSKGVQDKAIVSIPYVDALGLGLLTSIVYPCFHQGKFVGVVGTDITMSDLLADATYFIQGQASYAFVADSSGRTMIHPLLPKPSDVNQAPFFVDIRDLEPEGKFSTIVFEGIKSGTSGTMQTTSSRFFARGGSPYEGVNTKLIPSSYYWRSIQDTSFTLGIVLKENDQAHLMTSVTRPQGFKFLYHRLDLNKPSSPCKYFGEYSVKGPSIIKFSPQAFKNPYEYLGIAETADTVKGYANYFEGRTDTNTKFKDTIRNTVYATHKAEKIWLQSKTSLSQYVVWRYIGTRDGVFRMIPGAAMPKHFDASTRPWYLAAASNIGKTTISTPYVDAAGAGVIVAAAHTIYKGSGDNLHTTADDVMAVMGADFPLTYFRKLLVDSYSKCKTYSCFVMDESGFLIYHESFMSSSVTTKDVQLVHITQKEKSVAGDMIKRGILTRKQCRNIANIKTTNFYTVTATSGAEYLTSDSVDYNIHPIANTNAFLGIIERQGSCGSCQGCTCSTDAKNKPCLGLPTSCECPCASTLTFDHCDNEYPNSSTPICPVGVEKLAGDSAYKFDCSTINKLPDCFARNCHDKDSKSSCEGVAGCSWCAADGNGNSLDKPRCDDVKKCFGGREGTKPPGSTERCGHDAGAEGQIGTIVIFAITIPIILVSIICCCCCYWYRKKKHDAAAETAPARNTQMDQSNVTDLSTRPIQNTRTPYPQTAAGTQSGVAPTSTPYPQAAYPMQLIAGDSNAAYPPPAQYPPGPSTAPYASAPPYPVNGPAPVGPPRIPYDNPYPGEAPPPYDAHVNQAYQPQV